MHRRRTTRLRPHHLRTLFLGLLLVPGLASCGIPVGVTPAQKPAMEPHTSAAGARTVTYIAIGASDAFGVGTDDPQSESWPSVLARDLGSDVHLINLGIPGETAGAALQNELPVASNARPNVVTVWLAVNDIADGVPLDTYRAQLTTLLASLRRNTHARVFVANVPDLTILSYFSKYDPAALGARVRLWNAVIASVVAGEGDVLVDLADYSAALAQHPEFIASDGLHPSVLGAEQLAIVFAAAIHQAGIS